MLERLYALFTTPPETGRYAQDDPTPGDARRQSEASARAVEAILDAAVPEFARGRATSLTLALAGATYTMTRDDAGR